LIVSSFYDIFFSVSDMSFLLKFDKLIFRIDYVYWGQKPIFFRLAILLGDPFSLYYSIISLFDLISSEGVDWLLWAKLMSVLLRLLNVKLTYWLLMARFSFSVLKQRMLGYCESCSFWVDYSEGITFLEFYREYNFEAKGSLFLPFFLGLPLFLFPRRLWLLVLNLFLSLSFPFSMISDI